MAFARVEIRDKAAFLVRQYLMHNLYERLNTRPFLSPTEKRWILFQLLQGECHVRVSTLHVYSLLIQSPQSMPSLGYLAWGHYP
jgi:hypothetical protein